MDSYIFENFNEFVGVYNVIFSPLSQNFNRTKINWPFDKNYTW